MTEDIHGTDKFEDCNSPYSGLAGDLINKCFESRKHDAMIRMAKYIGRVVGYCPRAFLLYDGINCQEICNMPGRKRENYFYQCWIDYFMNGRDLKQGAIYHFFYVDMHKEYKRPETITIILNGEEFKYNFQDEDLLCDILKDFLGEPVTIDRRMQMIESS